MILLSTNNITQNIIYEERTPAYAFSETYIWWLPHFLTSSIIEFCQTNILLKLIANNSFLVSCVNIMISRNKFLLIIKSFIEFWKNKIGIINLSVCWGDACVCMCLWMHSPMHVLGLSEFLHETEQTQRGKIELKVVDVVLIKIYLFLQVGRWLSHQNSCHTSTRAWVESTHVEIRHDIAVSTYPSVGYRIRQIDGAY